MAEHALRCRRCRKRPVRFTVEVNDDVNAATGGGRPDGLSPEDWRKGLIRTFLVACAELGDLCPHCAELAVINVELRTLFEAVDRG